MTGSGGTEDQARALSLRLFTAGLAAAELMTTYLGVRLGLYSALAGRPATAGQLAERAGIAPRYSREWLEQQAASGILTVDRPRAAPEHRVYALPAGHREVLLDPESPYGVAPLVLMPIGGMSAVLPRLLEVFRSGAGVPYADYGPQMRGGQSGLNKRTFLHHLPEWIARHAPDVHAALSVGSPAIADVACGNGWSSIALADTYPRATVDGVDLDPSSVAEAELNAAAAGVGDRVRFRCADAAGAAGEYDLVCVFDALHDMPRPVEVLAAVRAAVRPTGAVLLLEPNVGEHFTAPAPETERFHYAVSVLHCLPVGMSEVPTAATGTVMRPGTVRRYARAAGFSRVTVIDLDRSFHRLYRLHP